MVAKTWDAYHSDILALAEKAASYRPDIICPVKFPSYPWKKAHIGDRT